MTLDQNGNLSSTGFCLGGTCQTSWNGFWIASGTNVYYNISGGNVGIGTAAPGTALQIGVMDAPVASQAQLFLANVPTNGGPLWPAIGREQVITRSGHRSCERHRRHAGGRCHAGIFQRESKAMVGRIRADLTWWSAARSE